VKKAPEGDSKGDFDKLKGGPADPNRDAGSTGVSSVAIGKGKVSKPLVVAIKYLGGTFTGNRFQ